MDRLDYMDRKKGILCVLVMGMVMAGCVHNKFEETLPDGTVTKYGATTVHVPFGKDLGSSHEFSYAFGAGNKISTGQAESGADSTGQVAAIEAVGNLLGNIAAKVLEGYLGGVTGIAESTGSTGNSGSSVLSRITELLQAVGSLRQEVNQLKK